MNQNSDVATSGSYIWTSNWLIILPRWPRQPLEERARVKSGSVVPRILMIALRRDLYSNVQDRVTEVRVPP
jgi:hypothetical protein